MDKFFPPQESIDFQRDTKDDKSEERTEAVVD